MKQKIYLLLGCFAVLLSCNTEKKVPNTNIEVATAFINDIHKGDFKDAEQFLLKEEANKELLDRYEQHFKVKPAAELNYYKNADVIINEVKDESDSVTIINYSTHYQKEEKNNIKVVKVNGKWLIDFKYTLIGK